MNKLGKLALVVVILTSLGSLYFSFQLSGIKNGLIADKNDLTQKLSVTTADLSKTKGELTVKTDELTAKTAELADVNAKLSSTEVQLGQKTEEAGKLTARVAELEPQLQDTKDKLAAAEGDMQKIKDAMKLAGIEDIGNVDQLRLKLSAQADENRLLGETLIVMRGTNSRLKREIDELKTTPVGLRGKVAVVESRWNFLVLDVGQQQRVQPNTQFIVYRDSRMIGKVEVRSVGPSTSIAEVMPEFRQATPRAGDLVIH